MKGRLAACVACLMLLTVGWSRTARAQQPIEWREEWRPIEAIDLSLIVAGGVGSAFSVFVIKQPDPPRWRGGILFDEAVGDLLFAETKVGRERGQLISDIGYFTLLFAVPLVDSSVAWLYHTQPDVAAPMLGIYAESIAITGFFANLLPRIIGRERPLIGEECYRNPELSGCRGRAAVSFPSGHTAMVLAGASTMFVQHAFLPVYGDGAGEVVDGRRGHDRRPYHLPKTPRHRRRRRGPAGSQHRHRRPVSHALSAPESPRGADRRVDRQPLRRCPVGRLEDLVPVVRRYDIGLRLTCLFLLGVSLLCPSLTSASPDAGTAPPPPALTRPHEPEGPPRPDRLAGSGNRGNGSRDGVRGAAGGSLARSR